MPLPLTEERVDAPIGKVQVFRAGAGDPLVYLHSAGGEATNPALEDLADSFAVSVPVFPGWRRAVSKMRAASPPTAVGSTWLAA